MAVVQRTSQTLTRQTEMELKNDKIKKGGQILVIGSYLIFVVNFASSEKHRKLFTADNTPMYNNSSL